MHALPITVFLLDIHTLGYKRLSLTANTRFTVHSFPQDQAHASSRTVLPVKCIHASLCTVLLSNPHTLLVTQFSFPQRTRFAVRGFPRTLAHASLLTVFLSHSSHAPRLTDFLVIGHTLHNWRFSFRPVTRFLLCSFPLEDAHALHLAVFLTNQHTLNSKQFSFFCMTHAFRRAAFLPVVHTLPAVQFFLSSAYTLLCARFSFQIHTRFL